MQRKNKKKGFFIKYILAIGDELGQNGEHEIDPDEFYGHPVVINDGILDPTRVNRIVKQIKSLAKVAKRHHNIERLTQVITDEFSFYTQNTPLSLDEYRTLINSIAQELKDLPPNIILIISSLPVVWSDGTMRNAVLHIQSPNESGNFPLIYHFSKEEVGQADPYYAKKDNADVIYAGPFDFYSIERDDYDSIHSPDIVLQGTRASCYSKNQYKSAIIVHGYHLPSIICAIDICLDHNRGVAKHNAKILLNRFHLPVLYRCHVVSSHSVGLDKKALFAPPIHSAYDRRKVSDVSQKKKEKGFAHFGPACTLHVYHQKRADILINDDFDLSAYKCQEVFATHVNSFVDSYNNTLLHQIFLPNKTSVISSYQNRQQKHFKKMIRYFSHDAINKQNDHGDTPLHVAIKLINDRSLFLQMLAQGARIDITNKEGETPIQLAYENNKTEFIKLVSLSERTIYWANRDVVPTTEKIMLRYAFVSKDTDLLDAIALKSKSAINFAIIDEITNFVDDKLCAQKWFYQHLLENELKRSLDNVNLTIIYLALSCPSYIDFNKIISRYTIAEQIFFKAYQLDQPALIARMTKLLNLAKLDINTIIKNITDNTFPNQVVIEWIRQTIFDKEIKRSDCLANIPLLSAVLTKSVDYNQEYYKDLIDMDLTLGEQLLAIAISQENSQFLDKIKLTYPMLVTPKTIKKVLDLYVDKIRVKQWLYQTLLKNEIKRDDEMDSNIIRFAIAESPVDLLNNHFLTDQELGLLRDLFSRKKNSVNTNSFTRVSNSPSTLFRKRQHNVRPEKLENKKIKLKKM